MILDPEVGTYTRNLTWSFKYSSKNLETPTGILIASQWNCEKKATNKLSVEFNAVSIKKDLNILIEISKQQTEALDEIKKEVFSSWKEMKKKPSENN